MDIAVSGGNDEVVVAACRQAHGAERIRLEGLRVYNAPYWSVLLIGCDHVAVRGLERFERLLY